MTKPSRCPTCHRLHKRSHPQNSRYWLLLHAIAEKLKPQGQAYSAETWHHYFKTKLIPGSVVDLPNGKTIMVPRSTTDLDVGEFAEYMTAVETWAVERDVWLDGMEMAA